MLSAGADETTEKVLVFADGVKCVLHRRSSDTQRRVKSSLISSFFLSTSALLLSTLCICFMYSAS